MRILAPAVLLAVLTAGCSRPADLKQVLQLTDVAGGYHDAGIVDGRNKLVPRISFRLKKSIDDSLRPMSLNVVFKQLPRAGVAVPPGSPAETDFDESYLQSVPFDGNQTALLTITCKAGYTGDAPQSRADMLKNSQFQDMRVHVFAKHSSTQWVEIATYDIPRQVLAQ
jgi:hypothetical protein